METEYNAIERRAHKRVRVNCTVVYRLNEMPSARFTMYGKDLQAKMTDISQTGMGVVTNYDIPVSTVLSMRFALLKVKDEAVTFSGPTEITGIVKSNVPFGENEHRLGIYFTNMRKIEV